MYNKNGVQFILTTHTAEFIQMWQGNREDIRNKLMNMLMKEKPTHKRD